MNNASPATTFDPDAFQLPDLIARSKGPENLSPLEASPELRQLEQQADREAARAAQQPSAANRQVSENLKQQVETSSSDSRADQLKPLLIQLKGLSPESPPAELRQTLLAALARLQACYTAARAPKDLAAISVLQPLLKCQAFKWDALSASQPLSAPAPEAGYLQKLRQLKSGMGPVERAALLQVILSINKLLPAFAPSEADAEPDQQVEPAAEPPPVEASPFAGPVAASPILPSTSMPAEAPAIALPADFDPMQATRLSLQLRAKLQRTYSPQEKQELQAQLGELELQQKAYFQARQAQALHKQQQEFVADTARLVQGKLTGSGFETWRKLRLSGLQNLARLFGQGAENPQAVALAQSAQNQLARLGMSDAPSWLAGERQRTGSVPLTAGVDLQPWWQAFAGLIDAALAAAGRVGLEKEQGEHRRRLKALEQAQADWQKHLDKIQALEADYLAAANDPNDAGQAHGHRQAALQAYADLLASLPAPPELETEVEAQANSSRVCPGTTASPT